MRMSCNGCRVLRKGCSDDCTIRPCLHWIASPDSQANATLFLAKFYGRAGLLNLINAGPSHLRPAIFRSLLYEACGRIINPVEGSVGLLCSGNWARCEAAVDGVLRGTTTLPDGPCSDAPTTPVTAALSNPAIKAFDIRHVARESSSDPVRLVGSTTKPRSKLRKPRTADHHPGNGSPPEVSPPVLNYPGGDRQDGLGLDLCLGLGLHQ